MFAAFTPQPTIPACCAPRTVATWLLTMASGVVFTMAVTASRRTRHSAVTRVPRPARREVTAAFLSPLRLPSNREFTGRRASSSATASVSRRRICQMAAVVMFWPAASTVSNTQRRCRYRPIW